METEDDSDVPETGAVFTYGKSQFGDNTPNKFWIRDDRVIQVECGDEHTVFVAESGRVFTFGINEWGQLGLNHNKTAKKPTRIKSLKAEKVIQVACGRSHTLVATESGKLYSFGANGEGQLGLGNTDNTSSPKLVEGLPECKCTGLGAGTDHSVALLENGEVYVWGSNSDGQLGLGEDETEAWQPVKLPLEERVASVACGYYHTALITDSGELYTFGETDMGKLGQGDDVDDNKTPHRVLGIEDKVTQVACGGNHTAAITTGGKLYSFGEGANGQLGHGTTLLNTDKPVPVLFPKGTKVKAVSCGENHTAVITEKGQLFTFGDGRHGKLALGEENFSNQFLPTLVQRFSHFCVEKVSCGGCHMLVTAKPRVENGDVSSDEDEEEDEEEEDSDEERQPNGTFRRGEWNGSIRSSMDLNGSFSARNRRREKLPDPGDTINRTMPPLHSSLSGRGGLQPLSATLPGLGSRSSGGLQPLDRGKLPALRTQVLTKEAESMDKKKKEDDDESGVSVTSEESEGEETQAIKAESTASTKSVPLPKPRPTPRGTDKLKEEASEDGEEEDDDQRQSEDEETEEKRPDPEGHPVLKAENSERDDDSSDAEDQGDSIKAVPVPALRSKPRRDDSMDRDSRAESDEEDDKKKKKKSPKNTKRAKKKSGLFGKKNVDVSESESEENEPKVNKKESLEEKEKDEFEEESEKEDQKKKKDKKIEKMVKTKNKKKMKEASEDDEKSEEDKKNKKKSKKSKRKESEDEESEAESDKEEKETKSKKEKDGKKKKKKKEESDEEKSEEEDDSDANYKKSKKDEKDEEDKDDVQSDNEEKSKKEKKEEETPQPKKKSKTCTIL